MSISAKIEANDSIKNNAKTWRNPAFVNNSNDCLKQQQQQHQKVAMATTTETPSPLQVETTSCYDSNASHASSSSSSSTTSSPVSSTNSDITNCSINVPTNDNTKSVNVTNNYSLIQTNENSSSSRQKLKIDESSSSSLSSSNNGIQNVVNPFNVNKDKNEIQIENTSISNNNNNNNNNKINKNFTQSRLVQILKFRENSFEDQKRSNLSTNDTDEPITKEKQDIHNKESLSKTKVAEESSLQQNSETETKSPSSGNINNVIMIEESGSNNQNKNLQQQHKEPKLSSSSFKSASSSRAQKNSTDSSFQKKYSSILKANHLNRSDYHQRTDNKSSGQMNKKFKFNLSHKNCSKVYSRKARLQSPPNKLTHEQPFNSDSISNKSNTDEDDADVGLEIENLNEYERMTSLMNDDYYDDDYDLENDGDEDDDINNRFSDDDVHNSKNNGFNDQDEINSQNALFGYDAYENSLSHTSHAAYFSSSNFKNNQQQSRYNYQKRRNLIKKPSGGSSSSTMSSQMNSNFRNYLFRTMSEMLSSQLTLTRKVDQFRENFISINRRLKMIEISLNKNSKLTNPIHHNLSYASAYEHVGHLDNHLKHHLINNGIDQHAHQSQHHHHHLDHVDFRQSKKRREDSESDVVPAVPIGGESDREISPSLSNNNNTIIALSHDEKEFKKEMISPVASKEYSSKSTTSSSNNNPNEINAMYHDDTENSTNKLNKKNSSESESSTSNHSQHITHSNNPKSSKTHVSADTRNVTAMSSISSNNLNKTPASNSSSTSSCLNANSSNSKRHISHEESPPLSISSSHNQHLHHNSYIEQFTSSNQNSPTLIMKSSNQKSIPLLSSSSNNYTNTPVNNQYARSNAFDTSSLMMSSSGTSGSSGNSKSHQPLTKCNSAPPPIGLTPSSSSHLHSSIPSQNITNRSNAIPSSLISSNNSSNSPRPTSPPPASSSLSSSSSRRLVASISARESSHSSHLNANHHFSPYQVPSNRHLGFNNHFSSLQSRNQMMHPTQHSQSPYNINHPHAPPPPPPPPLNPHIHPFYLQNPYTNNTSNGSVLPPPSSYHFSSNSSTSLPHHSQINHSTFSPNSLHTQQHQSQQHSQHKSLNSSSPGGLANMVNNNAGKATNAAALANAMAAVTANISPKYSSINDFVNGSKISLENIATTSINNNSDTNNISSNNIGDEHDYYDSGDEDSAVYQPVDASTFIGSGLVQHAQVRHVPSGNVDQLELSEEVEMLVSRDVIKKCIRKAKHRGNFAANLAAELFNKEERITCNCTGTRGKRQLSPRRLQIVKEITFRMYNSNAATAAVLAAAASGDTSSAANAAKLAYNDFEEAWRKECITAIDAKNRSIGRDIIKPTEKLTSNQQISNNFNENTLSPLSNSNSITNNTNETIDVDKFSSAPATISY